MSAATPKTRNFAKRIMTYEVTGKKSSGSNTSATFQVCDKLHQDLGPLMGNAGFRAFLSRALALASEEVPWLRAVHVKSDGSLEGLDKLEAQIGPEQSSEGGVLLLAHLIGLLMAFIGENLAVHLLREVWPKLSLNDLDSDNGAKNE
jgi:hypothetical protein